MTDHEPQLEDAIELHPTTRAEIARLARCQHPTTYLDHGRIVCTYCGFGTGTLAAVPTRTANR